MNRLMQYRWIYLFLLSFIMSPIFAALPYVPPELQPWQNWVLKDVEEKRCPIPYDNGAEHICVWHNLVLNLSDQKGQFVQKVENYKAGWVALPGDDKLWPKEIKINDKTYPIVSHEGVPSAWLVAGAYQIEGVFEYKKLPDYFAIPKDCGIVSLSINQQLITQPDRDNEGKVWLRRPLENNKATETKDELSLRIYRLFDDMIPLQETTRLILRVSGAIREINIGPVLQSDTVPLGVQSSLPARLEENGMLRVHLKPGVHTIDVQSRYLKKVDELIYQPKPAPWPKEEIWSFKPQSALRLQEITGGQSVDPEQAGVPPEFQTYPAYLMREGVVLKIVEKRRGQVTHNAEQLQLQRTMWLDFSGKEYTLLDNITGTLEQHWRLLQTPPLELKNVKLNGKAQLITALSSEKPPGIEVREGKLNLNAVSTIIGRPFTLPAVGWDFDVQSLSTTLILPPGWTLLGAWGVDFVSHAWLQEWTLLDLFLVLIIAAATFQLRGIKWGIIAGLTLALIYQEPDAPVYSWLNVIAIFALLRVLPLGRAQTWSLWYFRISFAMLVIFVVPFMVYLIRTAIYPQLTYVNRHEIVSQQQTVKSEVLDNAIPTTMPQAAQALINVPQHAMGAVSGRSMFSNKKENQMLPPLQDYTPSAKVQMGPAIPNWEWNVFNLQWNGPVLKNQTVKLWLLPSFATSLLKWIAVFLMGILVYGLSRPLSFDKGFKKGQRIQHGFGGWQTALSVIGMTSLLTLLMVPNKVFADFPNEHLLNQLKDRLVEGPDCLPNCATFSDLQLDIVQNQLVLRLRAQVSANSALPLPGSLKQWMPRKALVNGREATALYNAPNGQLWINLPEGVHELTLEGSLVDLRKFELAFPLKPKNIQVNAQGWEVTGTDEHQLQGDNLYFARTSATSTQNSDQNAHYEAGKIPPFVTVVKTLQLGQDWIIQHELQRVAPTQGAISVALPLIEGEQVLTEAVKVTDGKAFISLAEDQPNYRWQSKLAITDKIILKADPSPNVKEVWHVDAITRWHLTFDGIPLIHQSQQHRFFPTWQPWPGEMVTISVQRPEAVAGNTFAIDQSQLSITMGRFATKNVLNFTTRSSQGENHIFSLPPHAKLEDVLIDDLSQPITINEGQVVLSIAPSNQQNQIKWQDDTSEQIFYRSPKIDLNAPSSNSILEITLSANRWILFLGGPLIGPAVLFWGILVVVMLGALALGKSGLTPLKVWQWGLLGLGLVIATPLSLIIIVAWFIAMHMRAKWHALAHQAWFNWIQTGLALLTLAFVVSLFTSISKGLLDVPNMQICGPQFNYVPTYRYSGAAYELTWYQDDAKQLLPRAWIISLPLYVYRILMLLWALWLAFSLVKWLRWGWACYSTQGYWRSSQSKSVSKVD